jgi:DNA primase
MNDRRIPTATIERIRGRVDLVRLVEEAGVVLRQSGKNYIGKCPFHQDDSPSFSVSSEKQLYHCFGCGASGTVFTFVAKRENLDFENAVRKLAARAGIPLEDVKGAPPAPEEQQLLAANRYARELWHARLLDAEGGQIAREYLTRRGLRDETVRELQIGYAPDDWDFLLNAMRRQGFSEDLLFKGGLVRRRDDGGHYDYFRNRIVFPILNDRGDVVAFGGRAIDDAKPKYLNSPDTPLYKKSDVLYFLHECRPAIQEAGRALITEGYLDAISLYQAGVKNVVASLGTALSETHARLLKRSCEEVVFVFDGDEAGHRAVLRGAPVFLGEDFKVRICILPDGLDPDDFVRREGASAFRSRVADAVNLVEFQIRRFASDPSEPDAKRSFVRELADLLRPIKSPILVKEYALMTADAFDLSVQDVWEELRRYGVSVRASAPKGDSPRRPKTSARLLVERKLLAWMLASPSAIAGVFERLSPGDFQNERHQEIARIVWLGARESDRLDPRLLIETCDDEEIRELLAQLVLMRTPPDVQAEIDACVAKLERDALKRMEVLYLDEKLKEDCVDETTVARELLELAKQRRSLSFESPHPAKR